MNKCLLFYLIWSVSSLCYEDTEAVCNYSWKVSIGHPLYNLLYEHSYWCSLITVLISHFLLNLRSTVDLTHTQGTASQSHPLSEIHFSQNSFGGSVPFSTAEDEDLGEEHDEDINPSEEALPKSSETHADGIKTGMAH